MGKAARWIQQFEISPSELENWKTEEEALQALLLSGRIPQAQFLEWASERYNLPVIKDEYFSIPADSVFWERVKDLSSWSPTLFPLWQWDGVMLIGCIYPPKDFDFEGSHRFMLASAKNLKTLWGKFNPEQKEKEKVTAPAPESAPAPAAEASPAPTSAPPAQSASGDSRVSGSIPRRRRGKPIDESAPAPTVSASADSIDPTVGEKTKTVTKKVDLSKSGTQTNTKIKSAVSFDMPDGLVGLDSFDDSSTGVAAAIPDGLTMPGIKLDSLDFSSATVSLPDGIQENTSIGDKVFEFTSVLVREPKKEKTNVSFVASAESQDPDNEVTNITNITYLGREAITNTQDGDLPSEVTQSGAAPIRPMNACVSLDDLGEIAIQHVLKIFDGAMILIYQDEQLSPWKWSPLLKSDQNSQLEVIDLSTPSIFRIVRRTQMPYHGYIKPSEENDRFFAAFHGGTFPAHVTLVPIIWDQMLVGMLMGVSNMEIGYKSSLADTERIADELAEQIMRIRASAAA